MPFCTLNAKYTASGETHWTSPFACWQSVAAEDCKWNCLQNLCGKLGSNGAREKVGESFPRP
jgi:hypothetical protein